MKEFLEYAKSKGVKSIDVDTLCLINDFLKEQESKQPSLNGVVASVLCVESGEFLSITIGKKYELLEEGSNYYMVSNDLGEEQSYQKKRFKKL
tara:strand:- start:12797 stop:13075 length:279 start_codon:yes stop_codon:yes gene_type:complete